MDLQLAVSEALCIDRSCAPDSQKQLSLDMSVLLTMEYVLSAQAQESDPLCYTVRASLTGLTYPATVCLITSVRICLGKFETTR